MEDMLNLNDIGPAIKALTDRNRVLESALASILTALSPQPQQPQPPIQLQQQQPHPRPQLQQQQQPIAVTEKTKQKLHSTFLINVDGITHIGTKNNRALYQCDHCDRQGPSYIMKIHTCPTMQKAKEKGKKEKKEKKEARRRRKQKAIEGYTLESSKKSAAIFYTCDRCDVKLLESSVARHLCEGERPVQLTLDADVLDTEEEEENRDNPIYNEKIEGWALCGYDHDSSIYECNTCSITMHQDYVPTHKCMQQPLYLIDYDLSLL